MTKKSRTVLFLIIFSLFAFTAPMVILYAQGYRVDWKHGEIAKTGAMYIKTAPSSADITLNNSQKDKTSFFDGSVFIDNLLPGSYTISVSKKGYRSWQKTLPLASQEVIEAKNILLLPDQIQFRPADENVHAAWKAPNDRELLLLKTMVRQDSPQVVRQDSPQSEKKEKELVLFNIANQTTTLLLSGKQISQIPQEITWSPSGKELLLKFIKKPQYLLLSLKGSELEACAKESCGFDFLDSAMQEVYFTRQPGVFAVLEQRGSATLTTSQLSLVSLRKKERELVFDKNVLAATVSGDDIIWLTEAGVLKKQNRQANSSPELLFMVSPAEPLSEPLSVRRDVSYSLSFLQGQLFLKEGTRLIKINGANKKEEPVLSNIEHMAVSPDGKKIALANSYEIFLYYLEDQTGQPARKAGDIVFVNRFSRPLQNVSWLNANYLLYSLGESVFVSEIDNRDAINTNEIGQLPSPALFWDGADGILAVLSGNTLHLSDKLTP